MQIYSTYMDPEPNKNLPINNFRAWKRLGSTYSRLSLCRIPGEYSWVLCSSGLAQPPAGTHRGLGSPCLTSLTGYCIWKGFDALNAYDCKVKCSGSDYEEKEPDSSDFKTWIQIRIRYLYTVNTSLWVNIYILFTRGLAELDFLIEKTNIRGFCFFITSLHLSPINGFSSMSWFEPRVLP